MPVEEGYAFIILKTFTQQIVINSVSVSVRLINNIYLLTNCLHVHIIFLSAQLSALCPSQYTTFLNALSQY